MPTPSEPLYPEHHDSKQVSSPTDISFALITSRGNSDYFVSSDGHIFRILQLSSCINRSGYLTVQTFRADGKLHPKTVHSLVAEAFLGPRPEGLVINHIDGNKLNNCVDNLEYITASENTKHAFRIGLRKFTEKDKERLRLACKGSRKKTLSDNQITEMIKMYLEGGKSMEEVGSHFGLTKSTVCLAVNQKHTYKEFAPYIPCDPNGYWKRKITDEQRAEIVAAYSKGDVLMKDLAKRYNVSISTIVSIFKSERINHPQELHKFKFSANRFKKRKLTNEQVSEIANLYNSGEISMVDIGKQYNVSKSLISNVLKQEKIKREQSASSL